MISRLCPLLRTCTFVTKHAAPVVVNSHLCIRPVSQANRLIKHRTMSTVPDEILNEPARNLDYNQLLEKKKDSRTVLIDVREHSEINETGKLPDSIHIPLGELNQALSDMTLDEFAKKYNATRPGKDVPVVFSCKAGGRSRRAMASAYALGYANAAHYKGGWLDWAEHTKKN